MADLYDSAAKRRVANSAAQWLQSSLPQSVISAIGVDVPLTESGLAVVAMSVDRGRCAVGCLVGEDGQVVDFDILTERGSISILLESSTSAVVYRSGEDRRMVNLFAGHSTIAYILNTRSKIMFEHVQLRGGLSLPTVSGYLPVSHPGLVALYSRFLRNRENEELFEVFNYLADLMFKGDILDAWAVLNETMRTATHAEIDYIAEGQLLDLVGHASAMDLAQMRTDAVSNSRARDALQWACCHTGR